MRLFSAAPVVLLSSNFIPIWSIVGRIRTNEILINTLLSPIIVLLIRGGFFETKVHTKFVLSSWQVRAILIWVFPSQISLQVRAILVKSSWLLKHNFFSIRKIQTDLVLFSCFQCHEHVTNLVRASKNPPLVSFGTINRRLLYNKKGLYQRRLIVCHLKCCCSLKCQSNQTVRRCSMKSMK